MDKFKQWSFFMYWAISLLFYSLVLYSASSFEILAQETITENVVVKPTDNIQKYESVTRIEGSLIIENTNWTTLSGFNKLTFVKDSIYIANNALLQLITGFSQLDSARYLFMHNNASLSTFSRLPVLTTLGSLSIRDNALLTNVPAFSVLKEMNESIFVYDNPKLSALSGFGRLKTLGGLLVARNATLGVIQGFEAVTTLLGAGVVDTNGIISSVAVYIAYNPRLRAVTSFEAVRDFTGRFSIENNPILNELSNFKSLKQGYGNLRIGNNKQLKALKGWGEITELKGDLSIDNNTQLTEVLAFNSLTKLQGDFILRDNPALATCCPVARVLSSNSINNIDITNNATACNTQQILLNSCELSVGNVLGLAEVVADKPDKPRLFPNPVSTTLQVASPTAWVITVQNAQGQVVGQYQGIGQQGIDLQSLPSGVYWVQWSAGDRTRGQRIIKQ